MEFTLTFAETGHLCMATLHANNANQALDRILHLVPKERNRQFLFDLSVNLRAIVAQQLVPTVDGKNRRVAFEILYNTPTMAEAIRKGELPGNIGFKDGLRHQLRHFPESFFAFP